MKSEVEMELLKEYLDGDPSAEQELFARYDRELQVPEHLWTNVEQRIVPVREVSHAWWARIAAGLVLVIGLLSLYLFLPSQHATIDVVQLPAQEKAVLVKADVKPGKKISRIKRPIVKDNPGVISNDSGFLDIDEQDTAQHIERTENLLRSIRNFPVSDTDDEIDVTYDKALSRRLLIENVVLRRDAEMKAKFPTKTLLADLEPFLIDISNLPDHAKPEELRAIKERVQKTEIVAALIDFQDRGPNNR